MHAQLEAFVEAARRGSVTRAARALYVTQPALTARLNTLERTVGAPLLARRRGGATLTEAGRTFLPYAERALQEVAVGLLRAVDDPGVEQFTLYEDELVLVVHAEHAFGERVTLRDLRDEHFV